MLEIEDHFHSLERRLLQSIQEQLETKLAPHLHDLSRQQPSMHPNAHAQDHLQESIYLSLCVSLSLYNAKKVHRVF